MNRRAFLKALTTAVVGTAVALEVDPSWMPTATLQRETALTYLRRGFNEWVSAHRRAPRFLDVGRELFEAAEGEMLACMRFCPGDADSLNGPRMLMFKGARMHEVGRGWEIKAFHA